MTASFKYEKCDDVFSVQEVMWTTVVTFFVYTYTGFQQTHFVILEMQLESETPDFMCKKNDGFI